MIELDPLMDLMEVLEGSGASFSFLSPVQSLLAIFSHLWHSVESSTFAGEEHTP